MALVFCLCDLELFRFCNIEKCYDKTHKVCHRVNSMSGFVQVICYHEQLWRTFKEHVRPLQQWSSNKNELERMHIRSSCVVQTRSNHNKAWLRIRTDFHQRLTKVFA